MRLAKKPQLTTAPLVTTRSELSLILALTTTQLSQIIASPAANYGYLRIPKRDGGSREVHPPNPQLRRAQRRLLDFLYGRFRVPGYLHGGLPKKSAITHAKCHVGAAMVATLDVRDFFPSTNEAAVGAVLQAAGLRGQALDAALGISVLDGSLPQGSPVSCLLANMAFCEVDKRIRKICLRHQLTYSRFIDDLAISGQKNFTSLKGPFSASVEASGYEVAQEKIFFMSSAQRQVVTGLVVNEKLRPTNDFVKELKYTIRLCIDRGAQHVALAEGIRVHDLKLRLNGRVAHVLQCEPARGEPIRKLLYAVDWTHSG